MPSSLACIKSDYFNPRPPRGGRPPAMWYRFSLTRFQSTPSARRATLLLPLAEGFPSISIHALREEGDRALAVSNLTIHVFQSTPSARRATPHSHHLSKLMQKFQSTPSARRATPPGCSTGLQWPISIHALREEGDERAALPTPPMRYFNPRPPRGGRRTSKSCEKSRWKFQSTPSARRATDLHCKGIAVI